MTRSLRQLLFLLFSLCLPVTLAGIFVAMWEGDTWWVVCFVVMFVFQLAYLRAMCTKGTNNRGR